MRDERSIDASDGHGAGRPGAVIAVSDEALVIHAQRDRQAFAPLYERYAEPLYRFTRSRLGSDAAAEDVVASTMLWAMEHLERFDPQRGSFAAWLFTIAARRTTDQLRRRGRRPRLLTRLRRDADVAHNDVEDTLLRRDDAHRLWQALAHLPAQDQELVLLRYSTELSSVEIGVVLGIPASTVRVRLMRSLRRLANDLGGER